MHQFIVEQIRVLVNDRRNSLVALTKSNSMKPVMLAMWGKCQTNLSDGILLNRCRYYY